MTIRVNPNVSPRIITVPQSDGDSITIQNLVNQIRQWEQEPAFMAYERLLTASGKEDLGSGVSVGITAKLRNAKVKFADRGSATICTVSGGNLVAVDAFDVAVSPIEPSTNVTVVLAQSSSATINESDPEKIDEELTTQHGTGSWETGIAWNPQ